MFGVHNHLAKYDIKQKKEPACRRTGRQAVQGPRRRLRGQARSYRAGTGQLKSPSLHCRYCLKLSTRVLVRAVMQLL